MVDVGEDAGACEASEFFGSASPDLAYPETVPSSPFEFEAGFQPRSWEAAGNGHPEWGMVARRLVSQSRRLTSWKAITVANT